MLHKFDHFIEFTLGYMFSMFPVILDVQPL